MKSAVWLPFAVFLLLPLELCIAEEEGGHVPHSLVGTRGLPADNVTREMNLSITAAEKEDTKWQRDVVMPKLPQLLSDKRLEGYLDPVKRILAQTNVSQVNPAATANPQSQGDKLNLIFNQSLEIAFQYPTSAKAARPQGLDGARKPRPTAASICSKLSSHPSRLLSIREDKAKTMS